MDPLLAKYLQEKLGADYEKDAQKKYDEGVSSQKIGRFASNIGDAIAGTRIGSGDEYFEKAQKELKDSTLGKIDKAKAQYKEDRSNAKFDPSSSESTNYRKIIESQFPKVAQSYGDQWANVSAADADNIFKPLQLKETQEARKEAAALSAGAQRQARQDKQDEKDQLLQTTYGMARTADDAKKIKEAGTLKKNFDSKISELIKLREAKGGEMLDREAVARAKQLSKDLLLDYKSLAQLGVLSQSDHEILNAIIPNDPLEFSPLESMAGQDSILKNMKSFQSDKSREFDNKLSEMLRNPQRSQKTVVKTQTNQKTGEKRVVYSDGSFEILPAVAGGQ